jgi:hypothetical protein
VCGVASMTAQSNTPTASMHKQAPTSRTLHAVTHSAFLLSILLNVRTAKHVRNLVVQVRWGQGDDALTNYPLDSLHLLFLTIYISLLDHVLIIHFCIPLESCQVQAVVTKVQSCKRSIIFNISGMKGHKNNATEPRIAKGLRKHHPRSKNSTISHVEWRVAQRKNIIA